MRVSILTPTIAGREQLLQRARFTVRWQTWMGSLEHVVVDGTNLSPAAAFQQALDRARGELVMPLADDDWLAPHAVQTLHDALAGDFDFASAYSLINGRLVGGVLDAQRIATEGFYLGGAHMWRKAVTDQHGGFDTTFDHAADYDLYWRLAKNRYVKATFVPEPLYFYTDHDGTDGNVNRDLIGAQCEQIRARHLT